MEEPGQHSALIPIGYFFAKERRHKADNQSVETSKC